VEAAKYDLSAFRTFFLGSSRMGSGVNLTPDAGVPTNALLCHTDPEQPANEIPRWSAGTDTWDSQPYAWAGKRACKANDSVAGNLRPAPASVARAAVIAEFNPAVLRADMPILKGSNDGP
jgi:hypothetical protein